MLISKNIIIYICPSNVTRYKNLGYDVLIGLYADIDIQDVPKRCNKEVTVQCDFCNKIFTKRYSDFTRLTKRDLEDYGVHKDCCKDCIHIKLLSLVNIKYGVDNVASLDFVKLKKKETLLAKYGEEYTFLVDLIQKKCVESFNAHYGDTGLWKSESIRQKVKNTSLLRYGAEYYILTDEFRKRTVESWIKKYGVDNPMKSEEVKKKVRNTNLNKYGVECVLLSPEIKEKIKQTCIQKFGTETPLENLDIFNKTVLSRINNNETFFDYITSSQQKYIHNLYGGEINFNVGIYFIDIFFKQECIFFEYDGRGHDLCVKIGKISKEEFEKKEINRTNYIKSFGYKEFRLKSSNDKLPNSDILLSIKDRAFEILSKEEYSTYIYYLDTNTEYFE